MIDQVINGDSVRVLKDFQSEYFHLILSDIPYGISYEEWDVLHNNTNSALLGSSPAQIKAGGVFKHRGKPLNGWSKADKKIPVEYYTWCLSWAYEWLRVLKPGASVFIFAGRRLAHRCISALEDAGFVFKDMIAWEKPTSSYRAQRVSVVYNRRNDIKNAEKWKGWRLGNLRPSFEPILWFIKPYKIGGTIADNVVNYEVGAFNGDLWSGYNKKLENIIKIGACCYDQGLHPTQKPVNLMKALIGLSTIEGQAVLDPFCGSGSTLVAAKSLNRRYIGIEKIPEYVEIAKKRLDNISFV